MPSTDPQVSIVVTYHNEGPLLALALDSIFAQRSTHPFEVIVVDDASDLRPELPADSPVPLRLLRSEESLHASGARNLGIMHARGAYICFLDADDVYVPDRIDEAVDFLDAHPDVVLTGGQHFVHRDTVWLQIPEIVSRFYPQLTKTTCVLPDSVRFNVCLGYPFHTGSITVRKLGVDRVHGFDQHYRWGEEWDLQVRLAQVGRLGYIAAPAVRYMAREGSICSTPDPRKHESAAEMSRSWRHAIVDLPEHHRRHLRHWEHGSRLLAAQEFLERDHDSNRALRNSVIACGCGVSLWGLRSLVRTSLHCVADGVR